MKTTYFVILALVLISCSETIDPPKGGLSSSLTVTTLHNSLKGGGQWFSGHWLAKEDVGTWYDLLSDYNVKNNSQSALNLRISYEVGLLRNGKFELERNELFFDTTFEFKGSDEFNTILNSNSETVFSWSMPIGIGRYKTLTWEHPYATRLMIKDLASGDSLVLIDSLEGSYPSNRYKGVVYTTENSPDPLGIIDGPEIDDWGSANNDSIKLFPVYPNPSDGDNYYGVLRFQLLKRIDSLYISLNMTDSKIYEFLDSTSSVEVGSYPYAVSVPGARNGMYRLFFSAWVKGKRYTLHGDVIKSE